MIKTKTMTLKRHDDGRYEVITTKNTLHYIVGQVLTEKEVEHAIKATHIDVVIKR